jgi:hypothetical protein
MYRASPGVSRKFLRYFGFQHLKYPCLTVGGYTLHLQAGIIRPPLQLPGIPACKKLFFEEIIKLGEIGMEIYRYNHL